MTQAPSRNPSSVLKRPLDQHHLGCINLGQSVLVPYQPSASSYATGHINSIRIQVHVIDWIIVESLHQLLCGFP